MLRYKERLINRGYRCTSRVLGISCILPSIRLFVHPPSQRSLYIMLAKGEAKSWLKSFEVARRIFSAAAPLNFFFWSVAYVQFT
ncbi:hypothetical protein M434DRAFT_179008 [Hypoxylon sp. CO27-5]|nr:hypothetical protein M434DRAFT_179008 [Hypoxylon sp. CO27-5]